jgi:predicted MFS family arabinose efflux permease
MKRPSWILAIIVFSQFCGTSLWFASNGIAADLISDFSLSPGAIGNFTSVVQLGFILGTLLFALFSVADRFSPSRVFFACAVAGATFNLGLLFNWNNQFSLMAFRFLTGFFLAGIYPVGMKIAADYFQEGLGKSLGLLVGALVVGTAFPHLLRGYSEELPWREIIVFISVVAVLGGLLILVFVPDGPYRKPGSNLNLNASFKVFKSKHFRSAAFGYFGHMWELYAFWAFVPVMLRTYLKLHPGTIINIPLFSFLIIGLGGLASVSGGYIANFWGTKNTAATALFVSGICCLVSPLVFYTGSTIVFIGFLIFWGLAVIMDSPLFSTLVAQNAAAELKGTALTIVNSIGFAVTIISIQLINKIGISEGQIYIYMLLAVGPVLGLFGMVEKKLSGFLRSFV